MTVLSRHASVNRGKRRKGNVVVLELLRLERNIELALDKWAAERRHRLQPADDFDFAGVEALARKLAPLPPLHKPIPFPSGGRAA